MDLGSTPAYSGATPQVHSTPNHAWDSSMTPSREEDSVWNPNVSTAAVDDNSTTQGFQQSEPDSNSSWASSGVCVTIKDASLQGKQGHILNVTGGVARVQYTKDNGASAIIDLRTGLLEPTVPNSVHQR